MTDSMRFARFYHFLGGTVRARPWKHFHLSFFSAAAPAHDGHTPGRRTDDLALHNVCYCYNSSPIRNKFAGRLVRNGGQSGATLVCRYVRYLQHTKRGRLCRRLTHCLKKQAEELRGYTCTYVTIT